MAEGWTDFHCIPCVPISTMVLPRQTRPFGAIGVKVWVFNGEILDKAKKDDAGLLVRKSPKERTDGVEARS